MKNFKFYVSLLILLAISSCEIKTNHQSNIQVNSTPSIANDTLQYVKFANEEIIGVWMKKTPATINDESSVAHDILEIYFKEDSTAEVKISDLSGTRSIIGKWSSGKSDNYKKAIETNVNKVLGSETNYDHGVTLEYLRNGQGMNLISFLPEQSGSRLILKSGQTIFEKKY